MKVELFFAPPPPHNFSRSVQSAEVMKTELNAGNLGKFKLV